MSEKYIIGIDQSTQGTKALLFNDRGIILREKTFHTNRLLMILDGYHIIRKKSIKIRFML